MKKSVPTQKIELLKGKTISFFILSFVAIRTRILATPQEASTE
jgi:hypothetical protein